MNLKRGISRKQSTPNFPKNEHFLLPDTHTYVCVSGGKKCSFFGKFGVLCFFEIPLLRFALLSYYQRIFLQFKWEGHLNNVAPIVFFNFELLQLMIYKSVFSTDINGCLKIILDLLTFKEKIDQFSV